MFVPEYGRPLIPVRFLRKPQLRKQRARVAGQPPRERAVARACARLQQPHGAHRTGLEGRLGVGGEAGQMVRDLLTEGCATMDGGQRRRPVWQGGTLATSVRDVQAHDMRASMHDYVCCGVRDEHQR